MIKSIKNIHLLAFTILWVLVFPSCAVITAVKNPPKDKPFVFDTEVKVKDAANGEEKTRLETNLYQQLDDSIKPKIKNWPFIAIYKNPAVLDTSSIGKSIQYMHYYLNGEGYFNDSIQYATAIKRVETEQRGYTHFDVWAGKVTRIDSLSYSLNDDSLQLITDNNLKNALIKKGDPFAQSPISSEMDRLVELYRNNGYLRFSRDLLYGLWDTVDIRLLQPTLDPIEQARQMEMLRERAKNPTASLDIRLKPVDDSSRIMKYYIGNVFVYPNTNADTLGKRRNETTIDHVTIIQNGYKFKPKIFPPNIYFKTGDLYNQRRYLRTLNRFNTIGSWRLVTIDQIPREGQDTVDMIVKLTPAPKFSFSANTEGSFSQSVISGNFVGLGFNLGLQNRNFLRGANLATSNIRYGVELGSWSGGQLIQTQQVSISNSIIYPRFIFPGEKKFTDEFRGNTRSIFSMNAANTERRYLYNLTSINGSWGYDFSWRASDYNTTTRTYNLGIKLPNIEYSYLIKRDSLDTLISHNPSIKNIFTDGFISSGIVNFTMPWANRNNKSLNVFRANFEESGLLTGLIRNDFLDKHLYRFVKLDAEYAKLLKWTKTSLVLRGFGGVGYELGSTSNPDKRDKLPFFKEYYSGGPNSMRAWQLRRLGPGSTVKSFTGQSISIPDRFGDVQLEANIEYRMPLFKVASIPVNGALFTDMGNVWYLKKNAGDENEVFKLSRLGTDLAIGSGAGVRIDFGFFVIRLDYAYKVKDPSPSPEDASYQNRFFAYPFFKGSQLQLGIGYPFIF